MVWGGFWNKEVREWNKWSKNWDIKGIPCVCSGHGLSFLYFSNSWEAPGTQYIHILQIIENRHTNTKNKSKQKKHTNPHLIDTSVVQNYTSTPYILWILSSFSYTTYMTFMQTHTQQCTAMKQKINHYFSRNKIIFINEMRMVFGNCETSKKRFALCQEMPRFPSVSDVWMHLHNYCP